MKVEGKIAEFVVQRNCEENIHYGDTLPVAQRTTIAPQDFVVKVGMSQFDMSHLV